MPIHHLFRESDLEAIQAAVRDAEAGTSGEIVPYVVSESDSYPGAVWKGTAFGALAGPAAALAVYLAAGLWGSHPALWIALPAMAGAAAGYLATAFVAPLKRLLAGDDVMELRVRRRASVAFLEQEVFRTRERTGILLFLSLFEHRVIVLGDSGIHEKVGPGEWDGIVATIVEGVREGEPGEALAAAVRSCGDLLRRHGVERRPDDRNELPDDLRRRET